MAKRSMIWNTSKVLALLATAMLPGACGGGSPQARSITLTFIRNAQSQADAEGIIATELPGTGLSSDGKDQAQQLTHQFGRSEFDSIYTSPMEAAQQTAAPLARQLSKQAEIVPGLQSIDAGWYNGKPDSMADRTYMVAPVSWIDGNVEASIPGSTSGSDFNSRFTGAIRKIYDGGHNRPVVFSQGTAIMVWTLMNVKNPKTNLLNTHPLPNIGRVVISGNPATGWKLVDWDGIRNFG
ncbi:phosphoglycerate mutase family protein [Mycobacterium ulcerans]|uniref:Conserved lipoprotein, LpqD n=1 Tax=Mycobacterium ulcerans (strain Agy99) TaxID=362242 RepID=A0PMH8_MYCUA|nr:histidine phosphatase family protein [Mycobacterium ulcerans]ABL03547.1 conserved lipoprotein, LpqD [Mycobacterium ulcerans Agy99]MEB3906240.1 phosphoglycerate mutase family protein [Mycobacterium ulcerans]MEB3910403.1 phosphoglycerate mutase family protein [Mycobacterium ulcerans]MEB3920661.1 phosphoglycerate mutase family protein [Mycobacterium ulcerans]MEB3924741.1 phosphoglycerate mutase family protein [Mycobacterium ulcerans]